VREEQNENTSLFINAFAGESIRTIKKVSSITPFIFHEKTPFKKLDCITNHVSKMA